MVFPGNPQDSRSNSQDSQSQKEGYGKAVDKPVEANGVLSLDNAARPEDNGNNG